MDKRIPRKEGFIMYKCPHANLCFLLETDDILLILKKIIKKMYCNKNFDKCSRYQLYLQGKIVPKNLLPNAKECLTIK
ncbi:hypothetical protein [Phosphitispora sp. TUW77]|uniref:hypothetical protein n=1 Tax=Phosphitispora sp. TUW77 TaxID=3152361 RepID=UPI003AB14D38